MALYKRKSREDGGKAEWWETPAGIRAKYNEASKHFRRAQLDYDLNQAFLGGEQWLYHNTARNTLDEYPRDDDRTRLTLDRLWPASRHIISRVLSRPLVFEVPPSDSDDVTVRGAQTARSVLMDRLREHNWEDLREQSAWNTWLGATAGLSIDWDPSKGTPLGHLPLSGQPFGTGDLCESALSISEMCWEPGIRDAELGYWWIRAQAVPPAEVQLTYDMDCAPRPDASAATSPLTRRTLKAESDDEMTDLCLVLTLYMRPSKHCPQGYVATIVGDEFVAGGPKPWPFPWKDRLNLVVLRETKVSGKALGKTVFSAAVPVQAAFNASWSNIVEHLKLCGNARLWVPDASLDGVEDLSDLPGEVVTFNSSAGIGQYVSPPQLPQWVIEQPSRLAAQMDDILGLHAVSRGEAPKNVESGLGISVLVEQDSTPLGQLTRELARGFERFATLALRLYEAKVSEPRTARLQVPGRVPETVSWTGEALAGQTRASVPIDAVMPRSRAASLAMAERLVTLGVIDKTNADLFARIADLPDAEDLLEGIDADAAKAEGENHLLAIGQICVPRDFDNHATHIAKHNWFRKSRRYESLDSETQEIVDLHVQAHETAAAEELGKQVAKMNVHPALAGAPTANEAMPLPQGFGPAPVGSGPAGAPAGPQPPAPMMGAGGPPAQ